MKTFDINYDSFSRIFIMWTFANVSIAPMLSQHNHVSIMHRRYDLDVHIYSVTNVFPTLFEPVDHVCW